MTRVLTNISVLLLFSATAMAGAIGGDTWGAAPNTPGQVFYVSCSGEPNLQGFELYMEILDGTGTDPIFANTGDIGTTDTSLIMYGDNTGEAGGKMTDGTVLYNGTTSSSLYGPDATSTSKLAAITIDTTGITTIGASWTIELDITAYGVTSVLLDPTSDPDALTDITLNIIPEPATMALLALGAGLVLRRRRR